MKHICRVSYYVNTIVLWWSERNASEIWHSNILITASQSLYTVGWESRFLFALCAAFFCALCTCDCGCGCLIMRPPPAEKNELVCRFPVRRTLARRLRKIRPVKSSRAEQICPKWIIYGVFTRRSDNSSKIQSINLASFLFAQRNLHLLFFLRSARRAAAGSRRGSWGEMFRLPCVDFGCWCVGEWIWSCHTALNSSSQSCWWRTSQFN